MPRVEQLQQKALDEFREKNINYKKRKKKDNTSQLNENIITFVCLFFLFSVVFLQLAKSFTPKIDTSVGNNTVAETDEVRDNKMKVDDRLKLIQFNDSMVSGEIQKERENKLFDSSLDEPVKLPSHKKVSEEAAGDTTEPAKTLDEKVGNIVSKNLSSEQKAEKITPPVPPVNRPPTTQPAPVYKVYVGLYQTMEQAQTAKSIVQESTLGQNAFVKLTENGYTLQIGSYSLKPQAEAMVNALKLNNFPLARLHEEK